jgi:hypothetical protein
MVMPGAFRHKQVAVLHSNDANTVAKYRATRLRRYPVEIHPMRQLIQKNLHQERLPKGAKFHFVRNSMLLEHL